MTHRKGLMWSVTGFLLVLLNAGCSSPDVEAQVERNSATIAKAKSYSDKRVAYKDLGKAIEESTVLIENLSIFCSDFELYKSINGLEEERRKALILSSSQPNLEIWGDVFSLSDITDEESKTLKLSAARAIEISKTSSDPNVLSVAAMLLNDGAYVMKDNQEAFDLYARSWALGRKDASRELAENYLAIKDYRNAYLWALRCKTTCSEDVSRSIRLSDLEDMLTPKAVLQIQSSAQDQSIIEVPGDTHV